MPLVSEEQFRARAHAVLLPLAGRYRSVVGPGRSGAVASVYASYLLGLRWLPPTMRADQIPDDIRPVLVVDTAIHTGETMRRLARRVGAVAPVALFAEPPICHFWYESPGKPATTAGKE
jgi:hypothetical protein